MNSTKTGKSVERTVVIGAGMAGLSAAILLAARGENVTVIEAVDYPGGKMRTVSSSAGPVDSGPTVFTMKYVFDELFGAAGTTLENHLELKQANVLARHAWDDQGVFDLHADREQTVDEIGTFFDKQNADGYRMFCEDSEAIFRTLKDTFIGAQQPGPLELGFRIGLTRVGDILGLRPFSTIWSALGKYFSDPRLRQLFGRYATYVGSSPFQTPATLMLVAHVEQEGVWFVEGGMHALARTMEDLARSLGAQFAKGSAVSEIMLRGERVSGIRLENGEEIEADRVIYCGDISNLTNLMNGHRNTPKKVPPAKRSLSAITWSASAKANDFPLHHHNVHFSDDYPQEFREVFKGGHSPKKPTVYVCAQDRQDGLGEQNQKQERIFCLINAPANGDRNVLNEKDLQQCQENMLSTLDKCGLNLELDTPQITQPADFNRLFPGSGGALYGRASHGWMASFARPGSKTKVPGLYLAGGSVHPGPGVPMATLSGMLAAEQMLKDHGST